MSENLKKTKIVATFGPAIIGKIWDFKTYRDPQNAKIVQQAHANLAALIKLGVNVFRCNFSHGSDEEQLLRVEAARKVGNDLGLPVSFLLDTKGPEIRVGKIENKEVKITSGSILIIEAVHKIVGNHERITVLDATGKYNMAHDVKVGSWILVDDGKLWLKVTKIDAKAGTITTIANNDHILKENKRINLPNAHYTMPFLSDKDKHDIVLAAENGFDYVAASFVNSAKNVNDIRKILNKTKNGSKVKIIAKIESTDGIKNLKEIVKASDGIMVARGDLGIEIPYYDVPYQQEQMVKLCREAGKPVIVATQMLDSMERQLMCTRAETTDVYYSVKIGADSTMTSGETAQGLFPIQAITSMVAINTTSEKLFDYDLAIANLSKSLNSSARKIALNIAKKVLPKNQCTLKATFPYELVVYFDDADVNLQAISAVRPAAHVVFITDDKIKATKYGVYYGISSYYVNDKKQAIKDYKKVIVNVTKLYAIGSKKVIAYLNNKFIH